MKIYKSWIQETVEIVKNLSTPLQSYTHGECGTVTEDNGETVMVKLDDRKKYPVDYKYDKQELRILKKF